MNKYLDIIVYGATGFTGGLCVKYLKENYPDINWGIAGRSKEKLISLSNLYSLDCEMFVADGDDSIALDKITEKTKVVLSTAGPFHRYGSKLVASCVKNSTHYVDITGENYWVKEMITMHHEEAQKKSIRIIPSCGFDSIPSDLGSFFAARSFGNKVKSIHSFYTWKGEASGGTIETMFSASDTKLNKSSSGSSGLYSGDFGLNPKDSVSANQKKYTTDKVSIEKNSDINAWTGPFIMAMANTKVVRRGAALLAEQNQGYGEDFIYKEHAYYSNRMSAYLGTLSLVLVGLAVFTPLKKIIRPFLKKPGQGPSQKVMDEGFFKCKFVVTGENDIKKTYVMSGQGDPGYKVTSKLVCESALSLLGDASILPGGQKYGGILTVSSGLGDVLISRLQKAGISFSAGKK